MHATKTTKEVKDKLHWSFGSTQTMAEKVFPEGFSADKSTKRPVRN